MSYCFPFQKIQLLEKISREEGYVDIKKWLIGPWVRRQAFGSYVSEVSKRVLDGFNLIVLKIKKKTSYLKRRVTFSMFGMCLPASSLFFLISSDMMRVGGLKFSFFFYTSFLRS